MKKVVIVIGAVLLLAGMVVADDSVTGYFATTLSNPDFSNQPFQVVQGGDPYNGGPYVDVVSIHLPKGKYLLNGTLQTASYGGNASIDCAFFVDHVYGSAVGGDRLNGSGDGYISNTLRPDSSNPNNLNFFIPNVSISANNRLDKSTFVGWTNITALAGGNLTISCLRTYGATDTSWVTGSLTAVKVTTLTHVQ